MGCDGGTIPRRDELVKVKKKPEAKDKDSELIFLWRYCFITQQLLLSPIVACGLGRLYNKIALIEALLNRDNLPEGAQHIKNLKDVRDLNLTANPVFRGDDKKGGGPDLDTSPHICPVIGLEMSGKFRFVALWSCGCVFSERALKEIATRTCHKCQKPFEDDDVVVLNGNEDDLVVMRERMAKRQAKQKKAKDEKKKNKAKLCDLVKVETGVTDEAISNVDVVKPSTSSSASASMVMKLNGQPGQKRLGSLKKRETDAKKMKADYSVAKDPQVTDVYKSLFTSHKSEQEQGRAHWVTYNPFYN